MQFDFEDVKTTVREHPVETIAVVSAVGLVGAVLYSRRQERKHQIKLAKIEAANRPTLFSNLVQRRRETRYVLDFAA